MLEQLYETLRLPLPVEGGSLAILDLPDCVSRAMNGEMDNFALRLGEHYLLQRKAVNGMVADMAELKAQVSDAVKQGDPVAQKTSEL